MGEWASISGQPTPDLAAALGDAAWLTGLERNADSFKDVHRGTFKITEFIPGKKIVWHVLQNYFNFVKDTTEWTGTDIVFEISKKGDKTEFRFTHVGLKPSEECYGVCHDAWGFYISTSLHDLIAKGKGEPNTKDKLLVIQSS